MPRVRPVASRRARCGTAVRAQVRQYALHRVPVGQGAAERASAPRLSPSVRRRPPDRSSAWIKAPCTATAGSASMSSLAVNHSIQRSTVSRRPLAHTGLATFSTSRATWSASPACCACSMADSGRSLASYHAAARTWSSGTMSGSRRVGARHTAARGRGVIPIPISSGSNGSHEEVVALEPIEHARRSRAPDGDVAQRTGHAVEDRCADQERHVGPARHDGGTRIADSRR